MRRVIGHPKIMRSKTNNEPRNSNVLQSKPPTVTCIEYGAMRHKMRSCKGEMEVDKFIPKGGKSKGNT